MGRDSQQTVSLIPLRDIKRAQCMRSLARFTREAWHIVEPGRQYIHGWHIDAICEHLEYCTFGDIQNLIINMPPRHAKSLLVSVFWPVWAWTFRPESRWLFSSYAANLAIRDSLKCRRIIQSSWYQELFGDSFQLTGDQNQKVRFENDQAGYRIATGVGGGSTGEGGEFVIVDDALKAQDAHSTTMREDANEWWDDTMSTRGNDPDTMVRVVVMQRLHAGDLTGHLLDRMAEGGTTYELLCLPAEYEPNRCMLSTGWADPRTEPGQLLWPERFNEKTIERLKSELSDPAGQLQQRPTAEGGGIFRTEWWHDKNRYHIDDKAISSQVVARWLTLDTAFKDRGTNDFSAMAVWELWPDYRVAVRHMWAERVESALLPSIIEDFAVEWNTDGKLRNIIIEDKGSGTTSIQTLRMSAPQSIADMIVEFQPTGTKEYRARLASVWCGRDRVLLPHPCVENGSWYNNFLDPQRGQMWVFPNATHDDMVDTFTMGIQYLENLIAEGWRARPR